MSKVIIQIMLGLVFLGLFSWFILYLFFSDNWKKIDKPQNYSYLIWKEIYQKNDKWVFVVKKNSVIANDLIYREWIDMFSEIYSQKSDYTFTDKKNIIDIKLWNWKYFLDFKNPFKKIVIHWNIYDIYLDKWWTIYVDNSEKYVKIISFNVKAKINFINRETKKTNFISYLYPHKFIAFSVKILRPQVNIDSSRLSQLTMKKFGYFKNSYTDFLKNKELIFIDTAWKKTTFLKESEKNNLINIINIYFNKNKKYNLELDNIKKNNVWTVFWIEYIKEYFDLFFNEKKKKFYYKTIILDDIVRLFSDKDTDNKISFRLKENLNKLKQLDKLEYKKIKNILDTYYLIALNDNLRIINSSKIWYINLFSKILNTKNVDLYLMQIYDKFNFWYWNVFLDLDKYFWKNKKLSLIEEEYYFWFIRENISSWFEGKLLNEKSFLRLLDLFVKYSKINEKEIIIKLPDSLKENLTKKYKDELLTKFGNTLSNEEMYDLIQKKIEDYKKGLKIKKIITQILDNEVLLEKFNKEIKKRYFKEKLDWDILIRNNNKIDKLDYLKKGFNNYIVFFENKKVYLDEDKTLYENTIKNYEIIKENFTEYFSALGDYVSYQNWKKYWSWPQIYENKSKDKLSKIKLQKFIYQFKWIDFKTIDLDIVDNYYYDIKNINIKWVWFSFKLYPSLWNRIDSIKRHNDENGKINDNQIFYKQLPFKRYSLSNMKKDYEQMQKRIKKDEVLKNKFKYENIFINIFFPEIVKNNLCEWTRPISKWIIYGSKNISESLNIKEWTYKNFDETDEEKWCLWKCANWYERDWTKCKKNNENRFIRYMKSVKLLWNNWEFSSLEPALKIWYNNLFVSQEDSIKKELLISFKNSDLKFRIKSWKKMVMSYAYLDWHYKLDEENHYFYNMKLTPYLKDKKWKISKIFGDNSINLIWNKDLVDFKYDMKNIMWNIDYIIIEFNKFVSINGSVNNIMYDLKTKKVSFN